MKCKLLIALVVTISLSGLSAQTSRGLSRPGKIENPTKETRTLLKASDLKCTISYSDPSGDETLTEGETATLTVLVQNNGPSSIQTPELKISAFSSWDPNARQIVKWMDPIGPGRTGQYTASMKWDRKLPSGSVTYSAKVIDTITNIESEKVEVTFHISGEGTEFAEPVFVDVDQTIPRSGLVNSDAIAIIIGNATYSHRDVPDVAFAINDVKTMKQYLVSMLGYREENIIHIENAAKSDFERIFGTERVPQGKLYNWVKPQQSEVFIYYSGHGAPDTRNKKAYFMPVGSDPNYVQIDGYPLEVFYQNLNKIPAKSITVVLDACFSGGSQEGMITKNASPMYIDVELPFYGDKIQLLTSATGSQIASWYPKGNHTLFTYYFLRAIRGEADLNRDRKITLLELKSFIGENVPYMARRLYNREQTPIVKGNDYFVICKY